MNNPPGAIPPHRQVHPRRPPAYRSVSLRHSPPAPARPSKPRIQKQPTVLSSPNIASDQANPSSSASPKLLSNKYSSGESSDAGKWFDNANHDACRVAASYTENDPPFFLRNSSSADTPPEAPQHDTHVGLPYRPNMMNMGTDASSTEDFRSVIDDLTIANKKLRQKLKKYEQLYDNHLQEEKLFEVKFHGLPDHKKKELEETLRKFASELDDNTVGYPQTLAAHMPTLKKHPTVSSASHIAESGYVSMSGAEPKSSSRSIPTSNPASNPESYPSKLTKSQYNRQQQSIQSFLHDVPSSLLPQSQAHLTDKSKKKLVVRRLEQIFAGKQSAPDGHQQEEQQEEVAQSAATADRREREATGRIFKPEGSREAHMFPRETDGTLARDMDVPLGLDPRLHIGEQDFAASGLSPDQRPTRPLDLDPHRAQVTDDNMEYIRHLGFTPPNMLSGEAPTNGHGWLYLNLLINMAQLHTLNVTPEFVKDALQDYSSHLEMSRDGRKVRWMGGTDISRNSGDSSSEHCSPSPYQYLAGTSSASRRVKASTTGTGTSSNPTHDSNQRARAIARAKRQREQNRFAYKPLFFHKTDSEDEDDLYGASVDDSLRPQQQAGDSSGIGSCARQSQSSKTRREDGPMIFYTKAKFCTDLSGDRLGTALANTGLYNALTTQPLGASMSVPPAYQRPLLHRSSTIAEPRGPTETNPTDVESHAGSGTTSSGTGIHFSPDSLGQDSGNENLDIMDFEASGLGGVHPDDNFSILVKRRQEPAEMREPTGRRASQLYSQRILEALSEPSGSEANDSPPPSAGPQRVIKEELISATRKSMPSSSLPPASFLPFDSTSSGEIDSDLDSDASSEAEYDLDETGPTTALQQLSIAALGDASSVGSDSEPDYSDDSDDSIDLLATARRLDPQTIRASEREYDAALADRLADEIPAGSSAATAGGGSGFNSPEFKKSAALAAASVANIAAHDEQVAAPAIMPVSLHGTKQSIASGSVSSRTKSLKRTRTYESIPMAASKGKATKRGKVV